MAAFEDEILCQVDSRPSFTCWKPFPLYSLARDGLNSYDYFDNVVRTLHLEDFEEVLETQQIMQFPLTERSHSHLTKNQPGLTGVWYGIDTPDYGENNWYGNVSLKVNFKSLLQMIPDYKVYFMEVVEYRTTSALRLLITTRVLPLDRYNPCRIGGPWYTDPSGRDYFLTDTHRLDGTENSYGPKVEIFFVLSDDQCTSLLNMSNIEPVNHSEANSGLIRKCKKYRSGDIWAEKGCPSPFTMGETAKILIRLMAKCHYMQQNK